MAQELLDQPDVDAIVDQCIPGTMAQHVGMQEAGQTQSIWMERLIASHIKAKAADQSGCSSE
jgi:hypothetical protein